MMADTAADDHHSDPPIFNFFNEIGIIDQLAQTLLERALPDKLKMSHFGVLNHFARLGGEQGPAELARAFQVTKGAMTNTVQRLRDRGLVEVKPDPGDGRGKLVRITDKGLRVRAKAINAISPEIAELETQFGGGKFQKALPFLRELRMYLDQARDNN
jgi:DNA-binding MarR family transcriptional regulator